MLMQQKYAIREQMKGTKELKANNSNFLFIHKGTILKTVGTRQLYYQVLSVNEYTKTIEVVSLLTFVKGYINFKIASLMSIVEVEDCFYDVTSRFDLNFGDILFNIGSGEMLVFLKYFLRSDEEFLTLYPIKNFTYDKFFDQATGRSRYNFTVEPSKTRVLPRRFVDNYIMRFDAIKTISPESHDMSLGFEPYDKTTASGALEMWDQYIKNDWSDDHFRTVIENYDSREFDKIRLGKEFKFFESEKFKKLEEAYSKYLDEAEERRRIERIEKIKRQKEEKEKAERKKREAIEKARITRKKNQEIKRQLAEAARKQHELVKKQKKEIREAWIKENWAVNKLFCVTVWQANASHPEKRHCGIDIIFHNHVTMDIIYNTMYDIENYIDLWVDNNDVLEVKDVINMLNMEYLQDYVFSIEKRSHFVISRYNTDVIDKYVGISPCIGVYNYRNSKYDYIVFPNRNWDEIDEIAEKIEDIESYSLYDSIILSRGLELIEKYPGMDIKIMD